MPNEKDNEKNFTAGMIYKSANVGTLEITPEELKAINKYTLSPLTAEEVFAFKILMCDNEVDRDNECFTLNALKQLQKLFIGRTMIKDHKMTADSQVARIYATELVQDTAKMTASGELYTKLVARCYIVKTSENESLIAEIKGGIKKEVSVSCAVDSVKCSICDTDNRKSYCKHFRGRTYTENGKKSVCFMKLDNAVDAYETSFVAVPAQRNAGTCKSYTGEIVYEDETTETTETVDTTPETAENTEKSAGEEVATAIKSLDAFIFVEKSKEDF